MIITFGAHNGREIERLEDGYLIWMVKADRGDFQPRRLGLKTFKMPADEVLAARAELKARGYRFAGSRIFRGDDNGENEYRAVQ